MRKFYNKYRDRVIIVGVSVIAVPFQMILVPLMMAQELYRRNKHAAQNEVEKAYIAEELKLRAQNLDETIQEVSDEAENILMVEYHRNEMSKILDELTTCKACLDDDEIVMCTDHEARILEHQDILDRLEKN